MPRPRKRRRVCCLPQVRRFVPEGEISGWTELTVDEYEALRLIDYRGFSQEECAGYMRVARTTAQQIYNSARRKLAEALVTGQGIRIEGGDYSLCDGKEQYCACGGIGGGAQAALANAGIRLYGGVMGDADKAAASLAAGTLVYNPAVRCDHHDHAHHGEDHHCGEHGCGEHHCH